MEKLDVALTNSSWSPSTTFSKSAGLESGITKATLMACLIRLAMQFSAVWLDVMVLNVDSVPKPFSLELKGHVKDSVFTF
jgi:hypothetical protein